MRANVTGLERMTFVKRDGFASNAYWNGDGSLFSYTVKKNLEDVNGFTVIAMNNAKPVDTMYSASGPLFLPIILLLCIALTAVECSRSITHKPKRNIPTDQAPTI